MREALLGVGLGCGPGFDSDANIRFLTVAAVVSGALYHPAVLRFA